MRQIQAASRRLAEDTGARLVDLYAALEAGDLTTARFRLHAAAAVAAANAQGVTLADLGITAEWIRQRRQATRPLGLRPTAVQLDQTRIAADLDRILDLDEAEHVAQLERLGRSEPLLTVAATIQIAMRARGATGWTRQLSGDSNCPTCVRWADGVVRSPEIQMARHLGCDCIQAPTF